MKWWVYGIIAVALGLAGWGVYVYIDNTQNRIERLAQDVGTLQSAKDAQDKAIAAVKEANESMKLIAERIQNQQDSAAGAVAALDKKFNKITLDGKRDLGRLAEARPDSIERIVNDGTDVVFRCMEISTGKPLTDKEKEEYDATGKIAKCPGTVLPN